MSPNTTSFKIRKCQRRPAPHSWQRKSRGRGREQWAGPWAELYAWAGPWACRERSGCKQRQGSSRHAASGHAPPCPGASTDFHVSQVTQRLVTGRGSQWEGTRPTVSTQRGLVSEWTFSTQAGCSHQGGWGGLHAGAQGALVQTGRVRKMHGPAPRAGRRGDSGCLDGGECRPVAQPHHRLCLPS